LPHAAAEIYTKLATQQWSPLVVILLLAMMVAVVAFIVLVERAQRRISVQYAKRVVGRRVMGGQSTHLPLKVNIGGVIPVIFASSLLAFPQTFGLLFQNSRFFKNMTDAIHWGEPLYNLLYVTGIIFFCYFYTSIIFNPTEVADNMRKYGGFIPGIRPGKKTAEFVETILTRITFVGAIYLALIALIPEFMLTGFHINHLPVVGRYFDNLPNWFLNGMGVTFYFGGTSLLIVVGVAMDTVQQIEAQLVMRHYDGFLGPRGRRIRGRRG
jgi:preprotein translocase subunit SecY